MCIWVVGFFLLFGVFFIFVVWFFGWLWVVWVCVFFFLTCGWFFYICFIERILILKYIHFSNIIREKTGDCVGNMTRVDEVHEISEGQYLHFFQRKNGAVPGTNLLVGDRVVVSGEENGLLGLATGYVREVSATKVSCLLGR